MQVAHKDDHVTHAVIGGGQTMNFGISESAEFFHILSSTLYSDQILAVVRETLCNAWDAHIDAGCTDKPIEITLVEGKFTIKDHGLGIAKDMMGPIYAVYGASTKKNDGKATGGFGLGCKSPFAYTDHFDVTSCHDGIKTIYNLSKSSGEMGGKPGIKTILSVPTEETGLTVSINIKDHVDQKRFMTLVKRIVQNAEMLATLNGERMATFAFSTAAHGFAMISELVLEQYSPLCIRYGNVIYPVDKHEAYGDMYDEAQQIMGMLSNRVNYQLVLQAPPHSISITPSRESLSMQDKTTVTVSELLRKFLAHHHNGFQQECLSLVQKKTDSLIQDMQAYKLLVRTSHTNLMELPYYSRKANNFITETRSAASSYMGGQYPQYTGFSRKDMLYRLTAMIQSNAFDAQLLKSYRKLYQRSNPHSDREADRNLGWFHRNITWPLKKGMAGNTLLDPKRLYVFGKSKDVGLFGHAAEVYPIGAYSSTAVLHYLPFLRKVVVLTHSRKDIQWRLDRMDGFTKTYGASSGLVVYVVPRIAARIEAARKHFGGLGVNLIDMTLEMEKEVERSSATYVPKAERPVGYPTLRCSVRISSANTRYFSQDDARDEVTDRVEKPLFYTRLNARSDKNSSTRWLPELSAKASHVLVDYWGEFGAVVFTPHQEAKLQKDGVPSARQFLNKKILELVGDKELKQFLSFSPEKMIDYFGEIGQSKVCSSRMEEYVEFLVGSDYLTGHFKLGSVLSKEKSALLDVYEERMLDRHGRPVMEPLYKWVRSIELGARAKKVANMVCDNQYLNMLDVDMLKENMESKDQAVVDLTVKLFIKALKGKV